MYSSVLVCCHSSEGSDANLPLRTTMPMGFAVFQKGGIVSSIALRTFRSASSLPHLRCGPRPLTAAGGQGPQDNTAYGPAHIHSCRLLPARSTRKLSISTIPPCACHDCPPTNRSLRSPSLRLRVQLIYLPAWDYLPSYGMGPYTIVRYGTIGYRTDSLFQIANTL